MDRRDECGMPRGACVAILAAGASRRMGSPKQLASFGGVSLVRHACLQAIAAHRGKVCVVTGAYAERVAAEVADLDVGIVKNDVWKTGQASSVRTAVKRCVDEGVAYLGILPVDMPLVDACHLNRLFDAASVEGVDAAASVGPDGPMAPCVFSRSAFSALEGLGGDEGALRLVRNPSFGLTVRTVVFSDVAMALDADTPGDLQRIERAVCKTRPLRSVLTEGDGFSDGSDE